MAELVKYPRYKIGDKVRVKFGSRSVGLVSEARGTYSPTGHVLYTVYVPMDPEPLMMLLREEEIEKVDTSDEPGTERNS
jgi:hypothetical protein